MHLTNFPSEALTGKEKEMWIDEIQIVQCVRTSRLMGRREASKWWLSDAYKIIFEEEAGRESCGTRTWNTSRDAWKRRNRLWGGHLSSLAHYFMVHLLLGLSFQQGWLVRLFDFKNVFPNAYSRTPAYAVMPAELLRLLKRWEGNKNENKSVRFKRNRQDMNWTFVRDTERVRAERNGQSYMHIRENRYNCVPLHRRPNFVFGAEQVPWWHKTENGHQTFR